MRRVSFYPRPEWSQQELETQRRVSESIFRRERLEEPLEAYVNAFEQVQGVMEDLLESTVDLSLLEEQATELLTN